MPKFLHRRFYRRILQKVKHKIQRIGRKRTSQTTGSRTASSINSTHATRPETRQLNLDTAFSASQRLVELSPEQRFNSTGITPEYWATVEGHIQDLEAIRHANLEAVGRHANLEAMTRSPHTFVLVQGQCVDTPEAEQAMAEAHEQETAAAPEPTAARTQPRVPRGRPRRRPYGRVRSSISMQVLNAQSSRPSRSESTQVLNA